MASIKNTLSKLKTINAEAQGTSNGKMLLMYGLDFIEECDSNSLIQPIIQSIVDTEYLQVISKYFLVMSCSIIFMNRL